MNTAATAPGTGAITHAAVGSGYTAPAAHSFAVAPAAHHLPLAPAGHTFVAPSEASSGLGIHTDHHT